jgi:hypothetical protein
LTRIYMDGRNRRIYTVAHQQPRASRDWSGPQPVTVPLRPGVLQ